MTETGPKTPEAQGPTLPQIPRRSLTQVPGVIAISLYMVLLAVVIVIGVVVGAHYPPAFLIISALLLAGSAGLILLFRWAWALGLAAVFLLAIYNLWIFAKFHQGSALIQGLLNLIFFLYLIRPEVREKLR